jgi:hypothetical protein
VGHGDVFSSSTTRSDCILKLLAWKYLLECFGEFHLAPVDKEWRCDELIVVIRARIQRAEVVVGLVNSEVTCNVEDASVAMLTRFARVDGQYPP